MAAWAFAVAANRLASCPVACGTRRLPRPARTGHFRDCPAATSRRTSSTYRRGGPPPARSWFLNGLGRRCFPGVVQGKTWRRTSVPTPGSVYGMVCPFVRLWCLRALKDPELLDDMDMIQSPVFGVNDCGHCGPRFSVSSSHRSVSVVKETEPESQGTRPALRTGQDRELAVSRPAGRLPRYRRLRRRRTKYRPTSYLTPPRTLPAATFAVRRIRRCGHAARSPSAESSTGRRSRPP